MSFIKKSVSTLVTNILLVVFGMLSSIVIARTLGPELNGKVILLTSAVNLLFMLGNLGLGSSFTFFTARKKYQPVELLTFSIFSSILLGLSMVVLFFFSFRFHASLWEEIPSLAIVLGIFLTPLYILNNNLTRIVMGFNRIHEMNICNFISGLLHLISVVILIWGLSLGVQGVIFSIYISSFLGRLLPLLYVLRKEFRLIFRIDNSMVASCFRYGIKVYPLLLINFLNYRADLFLLKYFRTDIEVGYYSLAVGIAELIWLIPNSTMTTLFPTIAASKKKDKSLVTVQACRWSLMLLLFVCLGALIFGKLAITILYGKAYLPSYQPMLWLLPGVFLFPIFKLLTVDLAAQGYPIYGTITSLVALFVNIGLNLFLIPSFGAEGAAISTSISYGIMSLMSIYFFKSFSEYTIKDILFIPLKEMKEVISRVRKMIPKRKQ